MDAVFHLAQLSPMAAGDTVVTNCYAVWIDKVCGNGQSGRLTTITKWSFPCVYLSEHWYS